MALLKAYIDFKSPAAYLALQPTLALLEALQARVQWAPLKSSQRPVPAVKPEETRGETHIRIRENARQRTHLMYAALQGTTMNFRDVPGATDLALAALLYTQDQAEPFIQAAFHAYWVDQFDLNDPAVIARLLTDNGYDAAAFDSEHYLEALQEALTEAEEQGIVDAPGYLIDGNVFIGREHLPWIKALLADS